MRKSILFITLIAVCLINAQEITVDKNKADWAEIPILSEPGVFPYAKVHLTEDKVFYMLELDNANTFDADLYDALRAYVDADRSTTTGSVSGWLHVSAGLDYDITSVISPWNGSSMYWSSQTIQRQYDGSFAEAGFEKSQMLDAYPDGFSGTKVSLADNFGLSLSYRADGAAETYLPANDYNFAYRNIFSVKPRTIIAEDASGKMELISSNAYYMPFMNDGNIDEYLDFQSGAWSAQNPDHWASWALDLTSPSIYNVQITHQSADGGKIMFSLIDMGTNQVVFETTQDIWYAKHEGDFQQQKLSAQLDLSSVPSGKYMFKVKNNTTWGAYLKVEKIILENTDSGSSVDLTEENNIKIWNKGNTLFAQADESFDLYVYSTTGAKLFEAEKANSTQINLPQGVYIVRSIMDGVSKEQKVIVR